MRALTVGCRIACNISGMCRIASILLAFCACSALAQDPLTPPAQQHTGASPASASTYRIAPGDELSVTFPYNFELNHDGPVGPDGRFTMTFIGELPVSGLTISEATELIAKSLLDQGIVANAHPALAIHKYTLNVFVGGEVKAPGMVTLTTGMDALQAVLVAGGMLETAKTGHVAIIRRNENNTPKIIYLDLNGYTRGKPTATTAMLEPHDVIFVPRSSIAEVDRWIDDYINRTIPFGRNLNYNAGNYGATTVVP